MGNKLCAENEHSITHARIDTLQPSLLDNATIQLLGFRTKSLAKASRHVLLLSRDSPLFSLHSAFDR